MRTDHTPNSFLQVAQGINLLFNRANGPRSRVIDKRIKARSAKARFHECMGSNSDRVRCNRGIAAMEKTAKMRWRFMV